MLFAKNFVDKNIKGFFWGGALHKKIVTPLCVACPVKCAQPSVRLQREEKVVAALEIGQERS